MEGAYCLAIKSLEVIGCEELQRQNDLRPYVPDRMSRTRWVVAGPHSMRSSWGILGVYQLLCPGAPECFQSCQQSTAGVLDTRAFADTPKFVVSDPGSSKHG